MVTGDDVRDFPQSETRAPLHRVALDYVVFFGSPFAAPDAEEIERNVRFMLDSLRDLSTKAGVSHFAPHAYFPQFLRDEIEEERWLGIGGGAVHLKRSDEVVMRLPPWRGDLSRGMVAERDLAVRCKKATTLIHTEHEWAAYLYHLRQRVLSVGQIDLR